jgi:hypothetical protein
MGNCFVKVLGAALLTRGVTGTTVAKSEREACWNSGLIIDQRCSHSACQIRASSVRERGELDASLTGAKL